MRAVTISLIGPMGAGKTSLGQLLSKYLNLNFFDSDQQLEQQTQLSIKEIVQKYGESYFRQQEALIIADLLSNNNIILATGGGSILNAGTRQLLKDKSIVCYVQVSIDTQLQRLSLDKQRALLPLDPGQRTIFLQNAAQQRNNVYNELADITFDNNYGQIKDNAMRLLQQLTTQGVPCI